MLTLNLPGFGLARHVAAVFLNLLRKAPLNGVPASFYYNEMKRSRGAVSEKIGTVVIACPNEWKNMTIGRVAGELNNGIFVVDDFVSGCRQLVFSPETLYSEQKLAELVALTPYERYNAVARNEKMDLDKPHDDVQLLEPESYLERVLRALIDGR